MNIKVDEISYYQFLGDVKKFIEEMEETQLKVNISNYIEREYKLRELMIQRDQNYASYVKCKSINIDMANQLYQKYIIAKKEFDLLKGDK